MYRLSVGARYLADRSLAADVRLASLFIMSRALNRVMKFEPPRPVFLVKPKVPLLLVLYLPWPSLSEFGLLD